MSVRFLLVLTILALAPLPLRGDDEPPAPREEVSRKDLNRLQGTWQLLSLQTSGKSSVDVSKRTLFVGGELYLLRDGERPAGRHPAAAAQPLARRIDVSVRRGQHEDNTMLGIYDLKGDTLKVCFDPEGESRWPGSRPGPTRPSSSPRSNGRRRWRRTPSRSPASIGRRAPGGAARSR
ncbi:MAG: TIGR03067 domain-containing protein [Gemmataceae bacterium]